MASIATPRIYTCSKFGSRRAIMEFMRASIIVFVCACALNAQDAAPMRVKDVREIAKGGSNALPRLGELLKYPDTAIRVEAVRQITDIGTLPSLDLLVQ